MEQENQVKHVVREETLFAGIREPIKSRQELAPRMKSVTEICGDKALGPLVHILRFDTPVEGFDSEVGFPVTAKVNAGPVRTHTAKNALFFVDAPGASGNP